MGVNACCNPNDTKPESLSSFQVQTKDSGYATGRIDIPDEGINHGLNATSITSLDVDNHKYMCKTVSSPIQEAKVMNVKERILKRLLMRQMRSRKTDIAVASTNFEGSRVEEQEDFKAGPHPITNPSEMSQDKGLDICNSNRRNSMPLKVILLRFLKLSISRSDDDTWEW